MGFILHTNIVGSLVAHESLWAVYVANGMNYDEDDTPIWEFLLQALEAHTEFNTPDIKGNLIHGGVFFFNTEEEAAKFYGILCQPPIEGSAMYAELYNPLGQCLSTNGTE